MFGVKDKLSFNKDAVLNKLIFALWGLFFIFWTASSMRTFLEAVIIISPFLIIWLDSKYWKEFIGFFKTRLGIVTLAYLIFFSLTQLYPFPLQGLDQIRSEIIKFLFVLFSIMFLLKKKSLKSVLFWGCLVGLINLIFWGYYEAILGSEWLPWARDSQWTQAVSPMGQHKNRYAVMIVFLTCVTTGWLSGKEHINNLFKVIIISSLAIAVFPILILALARSAQISFFISIVFLILILVVNNFSWKKIIVFALVGIIMFSIAVGFMHETFINRWDTKSTYTLSGRVTTIWPRTIEIWRRGSKWLGWNYNRDSFRYNEWNLSNEHSLYLKKLNRSGLVGLGAFLMFTIYLLLSSLKALKDYNYKDKFEFLGFLIPFITVNLVGGIGRNPTSFLLEITIAVLLAYLFINEVKKIKTADK